MQKQTITEEIQRLSRMEGAYEPDEGEERSLFAKALRNPAAHKGRLLDFLPQPQVLFRKEEIAKAGAVLGMEEWGDRVFYVSSSAKKEGKALENEKGYEQQLNKARETITKILTSEVVPGTLPDGVNKRLVKGKLYETHLNKKDRMVFELKVNENNQYYLIIYNFLGHYDDSGQ